MPAHYRHSVVRYKRIGGSAKVCIMGTITRDVSRIQNKNIQRVQRRESLYPELAINKPAFRVLFFLDSVALETTRGDRILLYFLP